MTDGRHTPGPWTIYDHELGVGVTARCADVAHCDGYHSARCRDEEVSNARLIAASPDLLEAAKEVYEWMNNLPIPTSGCLSKMQVLHYAIAKATQP